MTLANATASLRLMVRLSQKQQAENSQCNHKLLAFIKHSIVKDLNSELCSNALEMKHAFTGRLQESLYSRFGKILLKEILGTTKKRSNMTL